VQGSRNDLRSNLDAAIREDGKDGYVVETAYNRSWATLLANRDHSPESSERQRDLLDEVNRGRQPRARGL
jgi:hypothetical protein